MSVFRSGAPTKNNNNVLYTFIYRCLLHVYVHREDDGGIRTGYRYYYYYCHYFYSKKKKKSSKSICGVKTTLGNDSGFRTTCNRTYIHICIYAYIPYIHILCDVLMCVQSRILSLIPRV